MTEFSQEWMLAQFKAAIGEPTDTVAFTDEAAYQLITDGCRWVQRLLAQHVPNAVRLAPEELTTANDGVTYTFTYFPFGHLELRDGRDGVVLLPGTDWDRHSDVYILEGNRLRFPDNQARTFTDGLWARYVPEHGVVDANTAPTLMQPALRAAIYHAAAEYADQGGAIDPEPYERRRDRELFGNPKTPGDLGLIHALKTQQFAQGTPATSGAGGRWWRSSDFTRGPE